MFAKLAVAGTAVIAATMVAATPAFAEDCWNASRSAQGNVAASQAGTWWSVSEVLRELGGLTDAQIALVMPVIEADSRIPRDFTVFYNPAHPSELAASMPAAHAADGKGIDHSDDYATPVLAAIFQDVAIALS